MRAKMIALVSLGAMASGQAWSQPCPDLPASRNAWASDSFDAVGYTGVTTTASPPAIRR